jgi:hypothetical protein
VRTTFLPDEAAIQREQQKNPSDQVQAASVKPSREAASGPDYHSPEYLRLRPLSFIPLFPVFFISQHSFSFIPFLATTFGRNERRSLLID